MEGYAASYGAWGRPLGLPSATAYLQDVSLTASSAKQVALASVGSSLSSYVEAQPPAAMYAAPADNAGAHLRAAYWLAVASRLGGGARLAALAASHQARGQMYAGTPANSYLDGSKAGIMADAAAEVQASNPGGKNKQLTAVARILSSGADPERTALAQQIRHETTAAGTVVEPALQLLPGGAPPARGPSPWLYVGIGAAVLAAVGFGAFKVRQTRRRVAAARWVAARESW